MKSRIQIESITPDAYKGMFRLENYLKMSSLDIRHKHLIYIRASQLNGCAFCIDMHTKEALRDGETQQRLFLLNAWKESGLFSEEEKLIIQMTEEITLIHQNGLTDETYEKAMEQFDGNYIAQIIMAIVTINSWNRISISTSKPIMEEYNFEV
ncbi:carboxymuconolactone decarboxylase family protein [Echinicola shivajiensis]|uniref:carboxymuconolactone decarboxylase family protein n=1 Tax=Echinicola shivajiensis TaxID=1035916 RepID=UPI001BFC5814|nr:carboxymuconolactone decarboxylase family protein [Echinicola shivajiensis]